MHGQRVSLRVLLLVALVAVGGTVAGATIVTQNDPDPVAGVEGELTASDNITVTNQGLEYAGTNVTKVNLTVNNTATSKIDGTVHVAVYNDTDVEVAAATQNVEFVADDTDSVEIDLAEKPAVETVVRIEVTIEEKT